MKNIRGHWESDETEMTLEAAIIEATSGRRGLNDTFVVDSIGKAVDAIRAAHRNVVVIAGAQSLNHTRVETDHFQIRLRYKDLVK